MRFSDYSKNDCRVAHSTLIIFKSGLDPDCKVDLNLRNVHIITQSPLIINFLHSWFSSGFWRNFVESGHLVANLYVNLSRSDFSTNRDPRNCKSVHHQKALKAKLTVHFAATRALPLFRTTANRFILLIISERVNLISLKFSKQFREVLQCVSTL